MENAVLFEILVPILLFITLSVFFVMMFIKNSCGVCQKKDEKSETSVTQGKVLKKKLSLILTTY